MRTQHVPSHRSTDAAHFNYLGIQSAGFPATPFAHDVELHRLTEVAAYQLAEKDGFSNTPDYYWKQAELEIYLFFE